MVDEKTLSRFFRALVKHIDGRFDRLEAQCAMRECGDAPDYQELYRCFTNDDEGGTHG